MNMLPHRHLPPTPHDAAIARISGQALLRFAQTHAPLKLRVTDAEQMEPIELPAGAVSLLMEILAAMAAGRGVTILLDNFAVDLATTVDDADNLDVVAGDAVKREILTRDQMPDTWRDVLSHHP